ncbi:TetR/AcrR family transcriptional regulator [Mariniluteicoccus flavus]
MRFDRFVPVEAPMTTAVGVRILDAAEELFYAGGITATGLDLVCQQADTTKRTLYQRFGSKDGLVAAYLGRRAHRWQAHLLAELDRRAPESHAAAIAGLMEIAADWTREQRRGCAFVNAWAELGGGDSAAVAVIRAEKAWMRALFVEAAGSAEAGEAIHQLYEGAQVCATVTDDPAAFTTAARASARLLQAA